MIFTIPNILTLLRLMALPVVVILFRGNHGYAAAAVFAVAMVTDCFDGWLARKLDQRSTFGLYLDPAVDKIVILALLYELQHAGVVDAAVPHLFLARELLQNGVRAVAAQRGTIVGANWMGKLKAALQTAVIVAGLVAQPSYGGPGALGAAVNVAAWALVILAWVFFGVFVYWNRKHLAGQG